jgi:hypothetical protein
MCAKTAFRCPLSTSRANNLTLERDIDAGMVAGALVGIEEASKLGRLYIGVVVGL